jgi:omega-amidase
MLMPAEAKNMSSLTFTIIQTDLTWEDRKRNLDNIAQKVKAVKEKTEIVVLPEMFSTGFSMNPSLLAESMDGPTISWMKELAASQRIILTGSIIIKEHENFYNRLIWMLPNGQYGLYDKRHRFAFAGEDEEYAAGSKRLIASVKGWKVNLMVCYDLRFPVWSRQGTTEDLQPEYDVLVYVANWPEKRIHAWKTLLQARAIENQCYVIGVNRVGEDGKHIRYSGDSMVIDPLGEILYQKTAEEDIHTITLEKEKLEDIRKKFPFLVDRDSFRLL